MKVTLKKAKSLLASVERSEANKKAYDIAASLIANVENDTKNVSTLFNIESYIKDCKKLDESLNIVVDVIETMMTGDNKFVCEFENMFTGGNTAESAVQDMGVKYFGNVIFKYEKFKECENCVQWKITKVAPVVKSENIQIFEVKGKSRAADMAKSRATAAGYIRDARLTERAAKSLESLCSEWNMNKTQVINKLLEDHEQRQLF